LKNNRKNHTRFNRKEAPEEKTWDPSSLYSTTQEWEQALEELLTEADDFSLYKGTLHQGKDQLIQCLTDYEKVLIKLNHVTAYARLLFSSDGVNTINQENYSRVRSITSKVDGSLSFIKSEISQLPESELKILVDDEDLYPYRTLLLEIINWKPYLLTAQTEEVLAQLGHVLESPYSFHERELLP